MVTAQDSVRYSGICGDPANHITVHYSELLTMHYSAVEVKRAMRCRSLTTYRSSRSTAHT